MRTFNRLAPLALVLLAACSRDPSFCPHADAAYAIGGRCYSEGSAMLIVIGWGIGAALAIWWIVLFVGLRRDVRRIAESLERLHDE